MILDMLGIVQHGKRFYIAQIIPLPDIQPLTYRHSLRGRVGAAVDSGHGLGQLLPDLLLRGAVDAALNLFSRSRVTANGKPGLPPSILALADRPAAFCVLLCHKNSPVLSKKCRLSKGQVLK